jgi:polysaccharide export outer membrane protein
MERRLCLLSWYRLGVLLVLLLLCFPAPILLARPFLSISTNIQDSPQSETKPPIAADKSSKEKEKEEKPPVDKGAKTEPLAQSALTPEQRLTYIIGVEDELQISVWREPELSTTVVVRPDGIITLPLINDVKAVGLKTEELQNILMDKLKNFVNEPQVTVIVRSIRSRKVYLVGEVGHQGTFPLNGDMTALELLAAAGGVGPFAKADSIYILREQNGKKIRIPFHYKKAVAGKSENVTLQPGDLVVVP